MLTTAKSIQLLDASGMNISPITDITSLYYEVANPNDNRIVSRKYVYDGFPVAVNINPTSNASIGIKVNTGSRHPDAGPLYINGNYYRVIDKHTNSDILVSNITTEIIPGTTYRLIKISNYNLSKILTYYTPLDLMDVSVNKINNDINNLNLNINNLNNKINNIIESLNATNVTLSDLQSMASQNNLTPNKFYLISNYGTGDGGCMDIPSVSSPNPFKGDNDAKILVKANTLSSLDYKIYEIYKNNLPLHVHGTYIINGSGNTAKLRITYLKDLYGNEAPYDFYNLKYKIDSIFYKTFDFDSSLSYSEFEIKNNIIKTNPFVSHFMPVFNIDIKTSKKYKITDNYIGYDNNILIDSDEGDILFKNNIIGNSNNIIFDKMEVDEFTIKNTIIQNNNSIIMDDNPTWGLDYNYININDNNVIHVCPDEGESYNLFSLSINSSNNITLYHNASKVIILNNCDGTINLSDNIIVDNYISSNTLTTTPNSVYLFGQNVYAKSFNTFK